VPAAGKWLLGWGGDAVAAFFFLLPVFGVGFIFDPLHADEERDLRLWLVKRNRTPIQPKSERKISSYHAAILLEQPWIDPKVVPFLGDLQGVRKGVR
jgi:hypothetical protein